MARDRDGAGRPRNARPRDELGRPLPLGATGVEVMPDDLALSPEESLTEAQRPTVRSIITVDVTRVADACGYVVPVMAFERERDQLLRHADNRIRTQGPDAIRSYVTQHNGESIDGLPGADPLVDATRAASE